MIPGQGIHGGGGDRVNRFVHSLGKLLREVADQERNIAVALAKWRDLALGNIHPVSDVGAGVIFRAPLLSTAVFWRQQTVIRALHAPTTPSLRFTPVHRT